MLPTPEMAKRKMKIAHRTDVSLDHPIDVLYARGGLRRHQDEDPTVAQQRRDAGAAFANLAWHVWGQPFAGIDLRSKRLVPPSNNAEDVDALAEKARRARQTDLRTPEERAEDVRARCEAMMRSVDRNPLRGRVLRWVAVECRPIEDLASDRRKRRRLLRLLLDALDLVGDWREIGRAEEGVRGLWARRAAEAA